MALKDGKKFGFTLIELLVVVAIIGLISSVVMASLSSARKKSRDARRLMDMKQIRIALELYYNTYNQYPNNTDNDGSGWDVGCYGAGDIFIQPLVTAGAIPKVPCDPIIVSQTGGYRYYRYNAGDFGCNVSRGAYYILGVVDMETSGNPYPGSPGFSCSGRNWQSEFDWVTGLFEK